MSTQRDLTSNGWAIITTKMLSNPVTIMGKTTIPIEPLPGSNENRHFCYDPNKVKAHTIGLGKILLEQERTIELQKKAGWTLVYKFQEENKGIFVKKIRKRKAA